MKSTLIKLKMLYISKKIVINFFVFEYQYAFETNHTIEMSSKLFTSSKDLSKFVKESLSIVVIRKQEMLGFHLIFITKNN